MEGEVEKKRDVHTYIHYSVCFCVEVFIDSLSLRNFDHSTGADSFLNCRKLDMFQPIYWPSPLILLCK